MCTLDVGSTQAEFLKAVDLIIWDEVLNSHRQDILAVDKMLQDLMSTSLPFGGKVVLFGGDLRQIPPVVPRGMSVDTISASFCSTNLWDSLCHFHLNLPVRDASDPEYSCTATRTH